MTRRSKVSEQKRTQAHPTKKSAGTKTPRRTMVANQRDNRGRPWWLGHGKKVGKTPTEWEKQTTGASWLWGGAPSDSQADGTPLEEGLH